MTATLAGHVIERGIFIMKGVCLQDIGKVSMVDIEKPNRRKGEAIIKILSASICGSDIKAFKGHGTKINYPLILGHEAMGEIVEIDADNPKGFRVGDHVIVDPYLYCGKCYACSLGRTNCCEQLKCLGVHVDGCMSEYFTHPDHLLIKVPKGIPTELAPLAEPLTIALHALHRTSAKAGEKIVIMGAGAIGLLIAMAALHYGAEPILVDIVGERLAMAQTLGVRQEVNSRQEDVLSSVQRITNGRMAEVVVEVTGVEPCIHDTVSLASYCGRIALTGWPDKEVPLETFSITKKELQVYGCRNSKNEFEEALSLISTGAVNVRAIVSEVVPFDGLADAIQRLAANPGQYIKIVGIA